MMKTVIITGASRGIGKAIAKKFAEMCYNVILIARDIQRLETVGEELEREYNIKCDSYSCDVGNRLEVEEVFKKVVQNFGSIDVLINNAGINSRKSLNTNNIKNWFEEFEENLSGWLQEIETNLTGTYICSYVASGYMIKQNYGFIINISSIKGKEPTSSPGYGASKAGVIKLTKDFARVLAPHNIIVNCIAPGFINTGMTLELPPEKKETYKSMVPLRRFGRVEEIAKVAAFLASPDSSYMTGTTLDVNGGYLMN